jgi:hypothetical protein
MALTQCKKRQLASGINERGSNQGQLTAQATTARDPAACQTATKMTTNDGDMGVPPPHRGPIAPPLVRQAAGLINTCPVILPAGNLTMSVKDPKDQLSNQNKKLNEPLCHCGEKMSKHGNYCSNGCDYAAPMEKDDQIDMAISSGCECLHHKLIKKRRNKRKR